MADADLMRRILALEQEVRRLRIKNAPWYAEGTYTPTYNGATPGTTTYTTQDGYWRRVGDIVFFNGRVTWTAATGTGNAQISLPFVPSNNPPSGTYRWGGDLWTFNVTIGAFSPQMIITQNVPYFLMYTPANNAVSAIIQMEAAGDVIFSGFYYV